MRIDAFATSGSKLAILTSPFLFIQDTKTLVKGLVQEEPLIQYLHNKFHSVYTQAPFENSMGKQSKLVLGDR